MWKCVTVSDRTCSVCLPHLWAISLQEPEHGQAVGHQRNLSRLILLELQHGSQHHVHLNSLDLVCLGEGKYANVISQYYTKCIHSM